ncbi:MAG: glutamate-ammonia-ligase adenylyltransferase, partial [Phycisphaeraceae bacterium]
PRRPGGPATASSSSADASPLDAGLIVDRFEGRRRDPADGQAWAERIRNAFDRAAERLADDTPEADQTRSAVNARVVARLESMPETGDGRLLPMEIEFEDTDEPVTRVSIEGQDSPAFLYALSTALSIHRLDIERVRIRQDNEHVRDELDLVDRRTRAPLDEASQQRVRLAALLTKQFTYFLGRAPDPLRALERFGRLIEDLLAQPAVSEEGRSLSWVDLVGNPRAMRELSKLLGASDYIWEDFIRGQYESLIPLTTASGEHPRYAEPPETIPFRLEQQLEGAVGLSEQRDRLNRFKNQELYRIDLDHILSAQTSFAELSRRLTALAEVLVATSCRLVYDDLVRSFGRPVLEGGGEAHYAVFGLGKLGGVALGYASDIELLFVYAGGGKTRGGKRKAISNAEFFETLTREATQFVQAKREGIFEVDLRLRPYGKNSPLAVNLDSFKRYYVDRPGSVDMPQRKPAERGAHPFERLALVRLRWIAGHPQLGFDVEKLRDRAIYDEPGAIEMDPLWDLLARQKREKNAQAKGRFNAKHGVGGLADLEGVVQLLQVTHARRAPQLRTPRVDRAIDSLHRAGVLTARQYAEVAEAYRFFRELINALRVLRGNAMDLFLPPAEAEEATHLARRMNYRDHDDATAAERMYTDLQKHTRRVSAFIEAHFDRPPPGA